MQRDLQFLLDMLQSAELIVSYTAQSSKDEFFKDIQLQDSVIRQLLVIASAIPPRLNIIKRINHELMRFIMLDWYIR